MSIGQRLGYCGGLKLGATHIPTGRVRHYDDDRLLPPPVELVIARHDSTVRDTIDGPLRTQAHYYLFYLDGVGDEMTDWVEPTLEAVLAFAESEFGITPGEWVVVDAAAE